MLAKLAYAVVGLAVVALSFSATLFALNRWSGDTNPDALYTSSISSAPSATALPRTPGETSLAALPKIDGSGFRWIEINRLNARTEPGNSVVTGQPILRLIPTAQKTPHTLAGQFSGLNKNGVYRITAWVRPENGTNVELQVADQTSGQPANYGTGVFNLTNHTILSVSGRVKGRGIDERSDGWEKVWLDIATSDGQFIVALRPTVGSEESFTGDGNLGVILGGIEAYPQH